jgi:hypothetical protein
MRFFHWAKIRTSAGASRAGIRTQVGSVHHVVHGAGERVSCLERYCRADGARVAGDRDCSRDIVELGGLVSQSETLTRCWQMFWTSVSVADDFHLTQKL